VIVVVLGNLRKMLISANQLQQHVLQPISQITPSQFRILPNYPLTDIVASEY